VRRWTVLGLVVLLPLVGAGCKDDTVQVTFRPRVGAEYRYEVTVHSHSEVRIPGEDPEIRDDEVVLQSKHTVLAAGKDGVRVQVILGDAAGGIRTFVVRFDRAAQLESVESDDDEHPFGADPASEDPGIVGISEIFPGATGAPPDRRLGPGARWHVDDRVTVPGSDGDARLVGDGRLVELGIEDDESVARLATTGVLELATSQAGADGEVVVLEGSQVTEQRSTHDLDDGAVRSASSTTRGQFDLEIQPPFGQLRDPVRGTLTVKVTSETQRLG
jgi:hypothetical protein